jgi:hypothetical protein
MSAMEIYPIDTEGQPQGQCPRCGFLLDLSAPGSSEVPPKRRRRSKVADMPVSASVASQGPASAAVAEDYYVDYVGGTYTLSEPQVAAIRQRADEAAQDAQNDEAREVIRRATISLLKSQMIA